MTISKRRSDLSEDRLKAAIAFGLGFTIPETAEFSGKGESTVKRWKGDPEFDSAIAATQAAYSLLKSKQVTDAVSEAVGNAEDRIKRIFDRATRLTERAVERVEQMGDAATLEQLMEMHKQITVWASKYAASEAPKRMQFEGSMEHTYKAVISLDEARNLHLADQLFDNTTNKTTKLIATDIIDITADA